MPAQRMETPISIIEAVLAIKGHDYLLPAIQREFVWTAEKTEALFDSLMRGYPVGSFLFWRVDEAHSQKYKFFEFMQAYDAQDKKRLEPYEIPVARPLMVVLDGQQRLTSMAIGMLGYRADRLKGKWSNNPNAFPKKRLYLNLRRQSSLTTPKWTANSIFGFFRTRRRPTARPRSTGFLSVTYLTSATR
jgi:uncharacterized protein with ParB-like and HNH nuclease domain